MFQILLAVIYMAFISLGLPDSVLGSAWPTIYPEFDVPVSYAGIIYGIISVCTILSSLQSDRLNRRFGTGKVTAFSVLTTAVALFGFSICPNYWVMMLWAIPYGLGAGSIDAALNNYVALHFKASHMNFLHCFYGVGVTVSPWILSIILKTASWRQGYQVLFLIQIAITAVLLFSLPLWKKMAEKNPVEEEMEILSIKEILSLRGAPWSLLVYLGSCGIEAIILGYGSNKLSRLPIHARNEISFTYRTIDGISFKIS